MLGTSLLKAKKSRPFIAGITSWISCQENLIRDLKAANEELNEAYQTTLEGWARALEMRDVETKGHMTALPN